MAGIPSHIKSGPSKKTAGSGREKARRVQSGEQTQGGSSSGNQQRDPSPMAPTLRRDTVSVQLTSSRSNASDLLFITTNEPDKFKDRSVQKEISRHVMKDYRDKQFGKESNRGKSKEPSKPRTDIETGVGPSNASSSQTLARQSSDYMSGRPNMLTPRAFHSSALTRDMMYPLNIDLSSLDFQQRIGRLLSRYMSVWFGAQATRLCGGGVHDAWEQWMPDEVDNDTLLYAQAFAAVNHINFLDPDVYQSERWALKGQAIQAMRETLNDPEAAWNDGNIGAVLCMAVVAPLEKQNLGETNFSTHMLGLQRMVAIRGGLRALRSNRILHNALCLCDLSGAIMFRTKPVLVTAHDVEEDDIEDTLFNSPLLHCDEPSEAPRQPRLAPDTIQMLGDLHELTLRWKATASGSNVRDSISTTRCALIERRLSQQPSPSIIATQSQLPHYQIHEGCQLAGQIYFRALYYNIPFQSPDNDVTMQALRATLGNSVLTGWEGAPGLLLWVLLVGTAAARSKSEEGFFSGHLSTTSFCLVAKWHDVQQILATFLRMERRVEHKAAEYD